jgi:hypothetical protein
MPVYIFGFPLGNVLANVGGNPAITVGRGSVSSIRLDADGKVGVVQIDGGLNPGNSGGPVVDSKGRLVGIANATIRGAQSIGFAIPAAKLKALLDGRVAQINLAIQPGKNDDRIKLEVRGTLVDPLERIKSVQFLHMPGFLVQKLPKANKEGIWSPLADAREVELSLSKGMLSGEVTLPLVGRKSVDVVFQLRHTDGDGRVRLTEPSRYQASVPEPVVKAEPKETPTELKQKADLPPQAKKETPAEPKQKADLPPKTVPETTVIPKRTVPEPPPIEIKPPETISTYVNLPGKVADVAVGGNGRYLILQIPSERKLAVFDANKAKVVKYLPLADDTVRFTAGMHDLIVAYPAASVLQRWNLSTLEREATVTSPERRGLKLLVMGHASRGPLLVNQGNEVAFLDPHTLKELDLKLENGALGSDYKWPLIRISANGLVIATSKFSGTISRFALQGRAFKEIGGRTMREAPIVLPGPDGRFLFSPGRIYNEMAEPLTEPDRSGQAIWYLPALHGPLYLSLNEIANRRIQAKLHVSGQIRPIAAFPMIDSLHDQVEWHPNRHTLFEKRIFLIPDAQLLVVLPPGPAKLELYRFDLDKMLENAGMDYLFVTSQPPFGISPATDFRYQLAVRSKNGGVRFRLESPPSGMTISDMGQVRWKVPSDLTDSTVRVLISVTDKNDQEIFHSFTLEVQR